MDATPRLKYRWDGAVSQAQFNGKITGRDLASEHVRHDGGVLDGGQFGGGGAVRTALGCGLIQEASGFNGHGDRARNVGVLEGDVLASGDASVGRSAAMVDFDSVDDVHEASAGRGEDFDGGCVEGE